MLQIVNVVEDDGSEETEENEGCPEGGVKEEERVESVKNMLENSDCFLSFFSEVHQK